MFQEIIEEFNQITSQNIPFIWIIFKNFSLALSFSSTQMISRFSTNENVSLLIFLLTFDTIISSSNKITLSSSVYQNIDFYITILITNHNYALTVSTSPSKSLNYQISFSVIMKKNFRLYCPDIFNLFYFGPSFPLIKYDANIQNVVFMFHKSD
ncbi:MAG: hypothetical protein LBC61_06750 [Candidatus Peribacteria bacterium]|jgi:hypothetical protein|nr:hypothetical protein [Candidatus Peribacteria bacterium]